MEDFLVFKSWVAERLRILKRNDNLGDDFMISNARVLTMCHGAPRKLDFRYTFFDQESSKRIEIDANRNRPTAGFRGFIVPVVRTTPVVISSKKKDDLVFLCKFLSP